MRERRDKTHFSFRQQARRIVKQHQLPYSLALSVAKKQRTLVDAIRMHNETINVERLIDEKNLHPSDAAEILRGNVTVDSVIHRTEMKRHLKENAFRSIFDAASGSDKSLNLWLHQQQRLRGLVTAMEQYSIVLETSTGSMTLPKIEVKAASFSNPSPRQIRHKAKVMQPVKRIEDRVRISNKRLYGYMVERQFIEIELLEGIAFSGRLTFIGRFELGITDKHGQQISVFRHALCGLKEK